MNRFCFNQDWLEVLELCVSFKSRPHTKPGHNDSKPLKTLTGSPHPSQSDHFLCTLIYFQHPSNDLYNGGSCQSLSFRITLYSYYTFFLILFITALCTIWARHNSNFTLIVRCQWHVTNNASYFLTEKFKTASRILKLLTPYSCAARMLVALAKNG